MYKALVLIAAGLVVSTTGYSAGTNYQRWDPTYVSTLHIDLVDPARIETLSFGRDGYVDATVGTKQEVAGPILKWKVRKGVLLIIDPNTDKVVDELRLLSKTAKAIRAVRKSGERVEYRIIH